MDVVEKYMARDYLVVKSNELIQRSRYALNLQEQKSLAYICSMIKPIRTVAGQEVLYELNYEFSIADYCDICGIGKDGKNYNYIKQSLKGLRDKSMWIQTTDGAETIVSWLDRVTVSPKSGKIKIRLDDRLIPYLFDLSQKFTQYQLVCVLAMKSAYSLRLYELLKSYAYKREKTFTLEELKTLLNANYDRYNDFKRFALDKAEKEINELTDLRIRITTKTGKRMKVEKISFQIEKKPQDEWILTQYFVNDELDY